MNYRLFDSHCHVHFHAYKHDYLDVIANSLDEEVAMITVGTQKDTSKKGIEVAEAHEGVWCTVGLHPNHLFPVFIDEDEVPFMTREEDFDYDFYKKLAQSSDKVVAIGENGLDFYRLPEDREEGDVKARQIQVFRGHLDLADELDLPMVMHTRDAHAETIEILREYVDSGRLKRRGVVHCYTGSAEHAKQYVEMGFYVGFTGIITFPAKKKDPSQQENLWNAVRAVPLDRLLVETDAPYLSPVPHRGERCLPQYVEFVAKKVAELHGVSEDDVCRITTQNVKSLFRI